MIRLALLGFGNVGRAFTRYLLKSRADEEFSISAVADVTGGLLLRDCDDIRRLLELQDQAGTVADWRDLGTFLDIPDYIHSLKNAGIAVLVECLPTNPADGQPALSFLLQALEQRLHVVTVDKGPIVHGYRLLIEAAERSGAKLRYSGTTGVLPPAEVRGCHVLEIQGILNGTTNYILTEMQERALSFEQALARAQEQGIAEPNPALDVQGWDTACKLLILANEWMDARAALDDVLRIGIGSATEELVAVARAAGRSVRFIGRARPWEGRIRLSVAPKIVRRESVFHTISGTSKGALFRTREKGEVFAGGVSGREAIAQTILDDVKEITR
jgi:homoserine dehydrogenase